MQRDFYIAVFINSRKVIGIARNPVHDMDHKEKKIFNYKNFSEFVIKQNSVFATIFLLILFLYLLVQLYGSS